MNNWQTTREGILATSIPAATPSYTPIPHSLFLEEIGEHLDKKGYGIIEERYITTLNNQVINGMFKVGIKGVESGELSPALNFWNSYDKSRKAGIRAGAMVLICSNGAIRLVDYGKYIRRHTGRALDDFREQLDIVIDGMEDEFHRIEQNVAEMKSIEMDKRTRAMLIGDMFLNERLITATQLNIIDREVHGRGTELFTGSTLWDFYNNVTESLKQSHPALYDKDHVKFHAYISDNFGLTGSNKIYFPIINN